MKVGIGQDSHAFCFSDEEKRLVLGGVEVVGCPPLLGNSDADVVLHALTNAISGVTGINILGAISDKMCLENGINDSIQYVKEALKYLKPSEKIVHVSFSIECLKPKISPFIEKIKISISNILDISSECIGITATTGEGLTDFGKGLGIQVFCIVTVENI